MRSIDEGRAVKLIAVALEQEGLDPDGSRSVKVDSGKPLQMDVGVKGRKYGFVYLTASDIKNLHGDALAQHSAAVEDLIIRTNEAEDEHFVVLYAQDYLYDDNSGESHEATMITAENKLQRDARDFIVIARDKEKWP